MTLPDDASGSRTAVTLIPHQDVIARSFCSFEATSAEPWLEIAVEPELLQRGGIEIRYSLSLYDDPVRPLLRFVAKNRDATIRVLPSPICGSGIWRGFIPKNTISVQVSPATRAGRFDFRIDLIERISVAAFLARVRRNGVSRLVSVLVPAALGYFAEAERAIDWTSAWTNLEDFPAWRRERSRAFEADGLDAPRASMRDGPAFHVVVHCEGVAKEPLTKTVESCLGQTYTNWKLVLVVKAKKPGFPQIADPRVLVLDEAATATAQTIISGPAFVACIAAGDELAPHAFAILAEALHRAPETTVVYADEIARDGERMIPQFKPCWSPIFEQSRPYLGQCVFARSDHLAVPADLATSADLSAATRAAALSVDSEVTHVRRWLLTRREHLQAAPTSVRSDSPVAATPRCEGRVSVIIPTRDRLDLLEPCIASILRATPETAYEVLIVDNNSVQADTREALARFAQDPRIRVIHDNGPFNYSAINNRAVSETTGAVLVFLNNDTVIQTPDWLDGLAQSALRPNIGAVGAKLLYPDGRVQHAGVVVGLGEEAGHFGALVADGNPSWLDRDDAAHEASAVTAACMAVERHKFLAVGGFDEVNLPIEYNDIDLCLRLMEAGWQALYRPDIRLTHFESASRGHGRFRAMKTHARERLYFRERWRAVIRDDTYFHPALSLFARQPRLG